MKRLFTLLAFVMCITAAHSQTIAYTQDGKRIVIFQNGTWFYADSLVNIGGGFQPNNIQSAGEMFNEAYDYAYEIMYGDEFFAQDRQNKSAAWAVDYLKQNIVISIGARSIENWYDELYGIAFNKVYQNTFFGNDRKQNAAAWARQLLEQKAVYDPLTVSSRMARTRAAYQLALNKIFVNEFFAADRKRKASDWATNFVRNRR
jgi:hypothetical protein